jgi:predicted transposase YdaD
MSFPFDATLKDLLEIAPADWLTFLRLPAAGPVTLIDADLSTIATQTDKVIRVAGPPSWILHLELQAGYDDTLVSRIFQYNALLMCRHKVVPHSVVVLLRREANQPVLTGELRMQPPGGPETVFRYTVVRLWEQPVEAVLGGGLGTLPLAPLTDVKEPALPGVIARMGQRLGAEANQEEAAKLWVATYVLMGLRYESALIDHLLQGVRAMEESVTYQAILEKGRIRGHRLSLLRQGQKKFGPPTTEIKAALEAITDSTRLEDLAERLLDVATWEELLTAPNGNG